MKDQFLFREDEQGTPEPETPAILSVSDLNTAAKDLLGEVFSDVWVAGEVSDLSRPSSGHLYFSLKDEQAAIRAVVWRSTAARMPFRIEDGQQLLCRGKIDLYVVRGSYQLVITRAEPHGVGELQLAFEQLKNRLSAEGLFDPEHKKKESLSVLLALLARLLVRSAMYSLHAPCTNSLRLDSRGAFASKPRLLQRRYA